MSQRDVKDFRNHQKDANSPGMPPPPPIIPPAPAPPKLAKMFCNCAIWSPEVAPFRGAPGASVEGAERAGAGVSKGAGAAVEDAAGALDMVASPPVVSLRFTIENVSVRLKGVEHIDNPASRARVGPSDRATKRKEAVRLQQRPAAGRAQQQQGRSQREKGSSRLDLHRRAALDILGADQLVDHPSPSLELVRRKFDVLVPEEVACRGRAELEDVDAVGGLDESRVAREDDEVLGNGAVSARSVSERLQ